MVTEQVIRTLLEELIVAWLKSETPIEIRSDIAKVRLLQAARDEITREPSGLVRAFYDEVFLDDGWYRASAAFRRSNSS